MDIQEDKIFLSFMKSECLLPCSKRPARNPVRAVISILITTFHVSLVGLGDLLLLNALNKTRYVFLIPLAGAAYMFSSSYLFDLPNNVLLKEIMNLIN